MIAFEYASSFGSRKIRRMEEIWAKEGQVKGTMGSPDVWRKYLLQNPKDERILKENTRWMVVGRQWRGI